LIEGIADYVRLRAGFVPPHWRPGRGSRWDEGYDATGYFLEWIEKHYKGFVQNINAILKDARWDESFFELLTGKSVNELWKEYQKSVDADNNA
jgi:Peptidase of plants and bacteria